MTKFDQQFSIVVAVDFLVLVVVTSSVVFHWSWLIPLIAGGVAIITVLAAQAGYLDSRQHSPLIPTATLGISGLMAASVIGSSSVFALLFAALPLFSGQTLLRRLPAALYGTALFLMSDSTLLTPEAVTFGIIVLLTLTLPTDGTATAAIRRARRGSLKAVTSDNRRIDIEDSLQIDSEESGQRGVLAALINYSGASAAAIYQPADGLDGEHQRTSQIALAAVDFDAQLEGPALECIRHSNQTAVWYRPEQLTTTRLSWIRTNETIDAISLTPIRIDDLLIGTLVLAYIEPSASLVEGSRREPLGADEAREIQNEATAFGAIVGELLDTQRRTLRYEVERREYQMITAAAETLSRAQTTEESLKIITQLMRDLTDSDAVAVYRHDRDTRTLTLQRADSFNGQASVPRVAATESLIAESCRRGHWLPYRDEATLDAHRVFGKQGTHFPDAAILVLPLLLDGDPLGAIVLGAGTRHAFDDEVRSRMRLVVSYLTFACSSIWRFEDTLEEATRDPLTGLMNRRAFMREASLAFARRQRTKNASALLMLDIDHFKRVNDTWGHQAGDEVIRAFADEIRSHTRKTDISCRYGGEEFVLFLEDTDQEGAQMLAERIRAGMAARRFQFDGDAFNVTTSGGVYVVSGDALVALSDAIDRADTALYAAKEGGRDRVESYSDVPCDE